MNKNCGKYSISYRVKYLSKIYSDKVESFLQFFLFHPKR